MSSKRWFHGCIWLHRVVHTRTGSSDTSSWSPVPRYRQVMKFRPRSNTRGGYIGAVILGVVSGEEFRC
jgi:hypothetical protein